MTSFMNMRSKTCCMRCVGHAEPDMMPVRSERKSNFGKSGWSSIAMYIVGTP